MSEDQYLEVRYKILHTDSPSLVKLGPGWYESVKGYAQPYELQITEKGLRFLACEVRFDPNCKTYTVL